MSRLSNRGVPAVRAKESVIYFVAARLVATRAVSRFSRPQPRVRMNDLGGRVIFGIADDRDSASTGLDLLALGHALHRVIRALGMKIRTNFANDRAHVVFWKNHDGIHIRQRRQNLRAFFGRHHGTPFTLQRTRGSVGVHRDNQFAAEFASSMQVAYMADMQHIETSVGQRDALAGAPPIRHQLRQFDARNNLPME